MSSLARILSGHRMTQTDLGVVALSCAATDDVTAWCLLAFVAGITRVQVGEGLPVTAGALGYVVFMLLIARPIFSRWASWWETEPLPRGAFALVFVALLLSALTTEFIGIHAIFGAFLLGAVIPHDGAKVVWVEKPMGVSDWQLYNLREDIAERTDLSSQYPDKRKELIELWNRYARRVGVVLPEGPLEH
jgi:Kef-type K+ transport system membrane component KefB